jgi:hypothetical protein
MTWRMWSWPRSAGSRATGRPRDFRQRLSRAMDVSACDGDKSGVTNVRRADSAQHRFDESRGGTGRNEARRQDGLV